jgi:hypothetical protein
MELTLPPMIPENCTFLIKNGELNPPVININKLHPHMMSLLGVTIDSKIIRILSTNIPSLQKPIKQNPIDCPKCSGLGHIHDDLLKHNHKKPENCKKCPVCKGFVDSY